MFHVYLLAIVYNLSLQTVKRDLHVKKRFSICRWYSHTSLRHSPYTLWLDHFLLKDLADTAHRINGINSAAPWELLRITFIKRGAVTVPVSRWQCFLSSRWCLCPGACNLNPLAPGTSKASQAWNRHWFCYLSQHSVMRDYTILMSQAASISDFF